jgi:CxxC-x17-CxxC domain-containing protein
MAKKRAKDISAQAPASAEQDIVGLITTLVQKLVSLEAKIDTVLSRTAPKPPEASGSQPMPATPSMQNRNMRPMYKAVCADCRKNCEVPFRPSNDRPVYCKDCFTARKKKSGFTPRPENRPRTEPSAHVHPPQKPPAAKPAAAAKKKKTAAKKTGKKK